MAHRLCGEGEKAIDCLQVAIGVLEEEAEEQRGGGGGSPGRRAGSRDAADIDLKTARKQLAITYNAEGMARFGKKNLSAARRWFSKAIDQDPDTRAFYVNRGDCCREAGELDACLSDYLDAIEAGEAGDEPSHELKIRVAVAFNEVGMQLYAQQQHPEAVEAFTRSIEQMPVRSRRRRRRPHRALSAGISRAEFASDATDSASDAAAAPTPRCLRDFPASSSPSECAPGLPSRTGQEVLEYRLNRCAGRAGRGDGPFRRMCRPQPTGATRPPPPTPPRPLLPRSSPVTRRRVGQCGASPLSPPSFSARAAPLLPPPRPSRGPGARQPGRSLRRCPGRGADGGAAQASGGTTASSPGSAGRPSRCSTRRQRRPRRLCCGSSASSAGTGASRRSRGARRSSWVATRRRRTR